MRGVRDDFILGRYEPWMVNTSLQGSIYSVPKMKASKGAFSIRSGLLLLNWSDRWRVRGECIKKLKLNEDFV